MVDKVTFEIYWTPRTDIDSAYVALLYDVVNADGTVNAIWDSVSLKEAVGYVLPGNAIFAKASINIPPLFATRYTTAYKLRLVSGALRPYGLERDDFAALELSFDFATVLRALGDTRNASHGEIEFQTSRWKPRVVHHQRRGVDHSQVENGLDLRFGKNVVVHTANVDAGQVVNRLLVAGYGDDRTQLVQEVRSLRDVQGRVPSDPKYKVDALGRPVTDPNWDRLTGGSSEDIYGPRYGVYKDANISTRHRAREVGGTIVELSAWPIEAHDITAVDLDNIPVELGPGDQITYRYKGRDLKRRVLSFTTDIAAPRSLQLTVGDVTPELATVYDRVTKDIETVLSFLNSQTTSGAP